jgi:hypothetical protein
MVAVGRRRKPLTSVEPELAVAGKGNRTGEFRIRTIRTWLVKGLVRDSPLDRSCGEPLNQKSVQQRKEDQHGKSRQHREREKRPDLTAPLTERILRDAPLRVACRKGFESLAFRGRTRLAKDQVIARRTER